MDVKKRLKNVEMPTGHISGKHETQLIGCVAVNKNIKIFSVGSQSKIIQLLRRMFEKFPFQHTVREMLRRPSAIVRQLFGGF